MIRFGFQRQHRVTEKRVAQTTIARPQERSGFSFCGHNLLTGFGLRINDQGGGQHASNPKIRRPRTAILRAEFTDGSIHRRLICCRLSCSGFRLYYVDPAAFLIEEDFPSGQCIQSIVAATADVLSRTPLGSTLANDDIACDNTLATVPLHTSSLTV